MTDTQLSLHFGFSESYFKAMSKSNPEKYERFFSFHENRLKSLELYIDYVKKLVDSMCEVMYTFEKKRHFGLLLVKLGITKMQKKMTSYYDMEELMLYRLRDDKDYFAIHFKVMNKWEKILKHYGYDI